VGIGWIVTVGGVLWAAKIARDGWKESARVSDASSTASAEAALNAQVERRDLDDEHVRMVSAPLVPARRGVDRSKRAVPTGSLSTADRWWRSFLGQEQAMWS
jgi:hypothetical protein